MFSEEDKNQSFSPVYYDLTAPITHNTVVYPGDPSFSNEEVVSLKKGDHFQKGIKIVGIDYISVDSYQAETLPVHHAFLSNDILIVEGLELQRAPLGRCKVYIMPNNIPDMDGFPVRVIAQL